MVALRPAFLILLLLLIATAFVSHSSASGVSSLANGAVTLLVGEDEGLGTESYEAVRRSVYYEAERKAATFISYDALKRNNIPCSRRGNSYYNCVRSGPANPYRRGCSIITQCARILN